jgi:putative spermidine/putrescine transport system ATP-binding protein
VRLRGLCKRFGDVQAVADVHLDVADGEFFCMLGPSGSGKTTVLRLLAGFETPTAGSIELAGQDVTRTPPFERDVNTVFQDYALFPHMTVADNIAYGLAVKRVARRDRGHRVDEALASVRLEGFGGRRPSQLSGGQRQRVALARALVNRPRVLLLDEPLGALDLKLRQDMQLELKQLQRDVGITFVFVTHDQDEALTMSDRIAVFAAGRIEQVGLPRSVYEHPSNEFVAGFVGTTNLLRGEVARAVLGQAGTWSVRPERVRLADPSEPVRPEEQTAEGTLRDTVYAGPVTRLVVDLDAGAALVASVPDGGGLPPDLRPGRRVRLAWHREHALQVG